MRAARRDAGGLRCSATRGAGGIEASVDGVAFGEALAGARSPSATVRAPGAADSGLRRKLSAATASPAPTAARRRAIHGARLRGSRAAAVDGDAPALGRETGGRADVTPPLVTVCSSGYARHSCSGFDEDLAAASAGGLANAATPQPTMHASAVCRHVLPDRSLALSRLRLSTSCANVVDDQR